jgi:LysR family carnitine catabolism transcriptional activator
MRIPLTLNQLEAFVRVADQGSFTKAAQILNISQPALSRAIRAAEKAVGARLFDRDTRNLRTTSAGQELLTIARRILAEFEFSLGDLAQFLMGRRGRVVVATVPSIGAAYLPTAIAAFAKTNPAVEFSIRAINTEPLLDMVASGEADFGISQQPPPDDRFHYEHLVIDEFVLLCATGHALTASQRCKWSDFKNYPFISQSSSTSIRALTASVFQKLDLAVPTFHECSSLFLSGKLIAAGLGITALPSLALPQLDMSGIEIRKLRNPVLSRRLGIVRRRGRTLSKASADFLELFKAHVRSLEPNKI